MQARLGLVSLGLVLVAAAAAGYLVGVQEPRLRSAEAARDAALLGAPDADLLAAADAPAMRESMRIVAVATVALDLLGFALGVVVLIGSARRPLLWRGRGLAMAALVLSAGPSALALLAWP